MSNLLNNIKTIHALYFPHMKKLIKDAADVGIKVIFSDEDTSIRLISEDGNHSLHLSGDKDFRSNLHTAQKWLDTFHPMSDEEYDLLSEEETVMTMVEHHQCPF